TRRRRRLPFLPSSPPPPPRPFLSVPLRDSDCGGYPLSQGASFTFPVITEVQSCPHHCQSSPVSVRCPSCPQPIAASLYSLFLYCGV
ncbi:hypothetical protein FIBSPDRAFT_880430, partial [Athelia psychrophila]